MVETINEGHDRRADRMLAYALVASLALHAAVVLPAYLAPHPEPEPPRMDTLRVELYGMVAERQRESEAPRPVETPPPPVPLPPVPKKALAPKRVAPAPAVHKPVLSSDSPVAVAPEQMSPPADTAPAPTPPTPVQGETDRLQKQTMLAQAEDPADVLRRYLAGLKRRLQSKLVYPDDAKRGGYEGTPVVSFVLATDGSIKPGSLVLARSSGYPALDANALKAAQASTPFDPPPRQIQVAIGVSFRLTD